MEFYKAEENRYADMIYRRCGRSGILLPAVSLGLWHNFGSVDVFGNFIQIAHAWRIIMARPTDRRRRILAGY